jgi:tRNA(fMet)-specific endonuclease VapC
MAVFDTTALVDLGNPRRRTHARAQQAVRDAAARGEPLCTTRANLLEMAVGPYRSDRPELERARVARVRASLIVLEVDEPATEQFGRVMAGLLMAGRPIGDLDTLVAAIALANGQSVVTRNPRHFDRVPGLIVHSY